MTNPSQHWREKSEEEKIEWLATKVMGWESKEIQECTPTVGDKINVWFTKPECNGGKIYKGSWNPLKDWNHWRQVEEKIMEDEELLAEFIAHIPEYADIPAKADRGEWVDGYMESSLDQRCEALFSSLSK